LGLVLPVNDLVDLVATVCPIGQSGLRCVRWRPDRITDRGGVALAGFAIPRDAYDIVAELARAKLRCDGIRRGPSLGKPD